MPTNAILFVNYFIKSQVVKKTKLINNLKAIHKTSDKRRE